MKMDGKEIMERAWSVRAYKKGDENGIFELMKAVYPEKTFTKDKWMRWWRWMFTESPAGAARIWLAEHDGKIVGQYPLTLTDMKVGGEITEVSQNIELMTHPDYRHQGMFLTLEKKALEDAEEKGINITIGFPNKAAYPGHLKTGWFDIGSLQIGVKPLDLEKSIRTRVKNKRLLKFYVVLGKLTTGVFYRERKTSEVDGLTISKVTSFDNRVDGLWKKISKDYKIIAVRDKAYLNWRYVDVPDVEYIIYIAEEMGELCGYIVLRCVREEQDLLSGSIFDLVAPLDRPEITACLLSKAIEYFKQEKTNLVSCLMIANKRLCRVFRKKGFIFSPFLQGRLSGEGQFCAYASHPNISKIFLMDKENWFIQLGDSDSI